MLRRAWFLALVFLVVTTAPAFSQVEVRPGFRAGVNISNLSGSDISDDVESITGFHAGGVIIFDIAGPLAIQAEGLFTQKGIEANFIVPDVNQTQIEVRATQRVSYIQINGLLKGELPVPGLVTPSVFAGPALGFKFGEDLEAPNFTFNTDNYQRTDISLVVGAGVDVDLGVTTLLFDVRYDLGVTKVFDRLDEMNLDARNTALGFSAGFTF